MKSSRPRVISLCHQKGGVGKSTLAICLAEEAARRRRRVLLVDADPQATVATWARLREREGRGDPRLSVSTDLAQVQTTEAELVIIDSPGRHGEVQGAALLAADVVLIPCGPTGPDAWALGDTLSLVEAAQAAQADQGRPPARACIVLSRRKARSATAAEARGVLAEALPVLRTEIGDRVAYPDALAVGLGVCGYAPRSIAAGEVQRLYDELLRAPRTRTVQP